MLGLKLNHVSKRGHWYKNQLVIVDFVYNIVNLHYNIHNMNVYLTSEGDIWSVFYNFEV